MTRPSCLPPPRKASLRTVYKPNSYEELDQAIALWFPAPNSFTGEDMVELHVHGSVAVVNASLDALASLGFGMACPGTFLLLFFLIFQASSLKEHLEMAKWTFLPWKASLI